MDLLSLVAKLTLDKSQYEQGLNEAESEASSAGGKFSGILGKVGGVAGKIAKVSAAGIAAGSAVVGALTKQSVEAYANYEQLVGGVETLFGAGGKSLEEYAKASGMTIEEAQKDYQKLMNAQDEVLKNADKAYMTAGMSANDYLDTVTGFSASLIQSLGGDTEKAAKIADQAIVDMSDNANKMGTSMESIQNAYSGFSKGNFTMLDNLKLGYGGTKEEMERLMRDAEKLSGMDVGSLDMSNFADIVEAIHIVQDNLGITGTTAKEASTTIEGSLNTVKGAWTNLVAGFADPDADLDKLMDNLIVAIVGENEGEGLINNLIPAVERALKGIGEFLVKAAPIISERLPELMNAILPSLLAAATSLIAGLVQALPTILQILIDQAPTIMATLAQAFLDVAPLLLDMVAQIFVLLVDAAGAGIEFLWNAAMEFLTPVIESIENAFAAIGDYLAGLWEDIKTALSNVWTAIGDAVKNAWNAITATISNILNGIKTTVTNIWNAIKTTISSVLDSIKTTISNVWNTIKNTISNVINGIKTTVSNVWNAIKDAVSNTVNGIKETITNVWNNIKEFVSDTVEGIKSSVSEKFENIRQKAEDIFGKVKDAITNPVESAKELVKNLIDDILGFFDFDWHLPELKLPHIVVGSYIDVPVLGTIPDPTTLRVEWYRKAYDNPWMFTKPTALGFGDGIGGEMVYGHDNLMRDIREAMGTQPRTFSPIINVYTQEGQSNEEIARKVMDILTFEYQRQGSVFA